MAVHELSPDEIGQIIPSTTQDLVAGTQEILRWHGLPAKLEFANTIETPRRDHTDTLLRHFEATNTGVMNVYNVDVSLLGAVKAKGRHVVNMAKFMISPTDVELDPEAFTYLARDIAVRSPDAWLLTSHNILMDLGRSVGNLARARAGLDVVENEYWIVTNNVSIARPGEVS